MGKGVRGSLEGARYPWDDTEPANTTANFADNQTEFEWRHPNVDVRKIRHRDLCQ